MKLGISKNEMIHFFEDIREIDVTQKIFLFGRTYADNSQLNVFVTLSNHLVIYIFGRTQAYAMFEKSVVKAEYLKAAESKGDMPYEELKHYQ